MDHPDDKPLSGLSENFIVPVAGRVHPNSLRGMKDTIPKRQPLSHLLRTAQGNANRTTGRTSHKRPKPSLPKLPWNDS